MLLPETTPATVAAGPRNLTPPSPPPPADAGARARASSMAILLQHQDHTWKAMDPASHSERSIENATHLVASLANKRDSQHSSYPYQQDEVLASCGLSLSPRPKCETHPRTRTSTQPSRYLPPRRRHFTKPPEMLQVEAAMSIIDHWAEVMPHPVDTWHNDNTWNCASRTQHAASHASWRSTPRMASGLRLPLSITALQLTAPHGTSGLQHTSHTTPTSRHGRA